MGNCQEREKHVPSPPRKEISTNVGDPIPKKRSIDTGTRAVMSGKQLTYSVPYVDDGAARYKLLKRPYQPDPPGVGREVIINNPSDLAANGCKGTVVAHDATGPVVQVQGFPNMRVKSEHLLSKKNEVVAYYSGHWEVRWFTCGDQLVRWTKSGEDSKAVLQQITSLAYRHSDKLLRDQFNMGGTIPATDWRRVVSALAPAAERCGVGHNLPTREVRLDGWYPVGMSIEAMWEDQWHPGSISAVHNDGSVDVLWDEDDTLTPNVSAEHIRPWMRPGTSYAPDSCVMPSLLNNPHLDFDDIYDTGKKLGEGGFGEVYEVVHKATGTTYAAKVLSVSHDTKDEVREVISSRKAPATVGTKIHGVTYWDLQKPNRRNEKWLKGRPIGGFIVHIGASPYGEEGWAGVVLDIPVGTHNGTVSGVRYFDAPNERGAFIKLSDCRPVRPHVTELWAGLDHPNLVKLVDWRAGRHCFTKYGSAEWSDDYVYGHESENYMVCIMEYSEGGDLERILKSPKSPLRIGERAVAHIMRSILSCLSYLHSHGIMHHDLKVSNVLVRDPHAPRPSIALCDMGLSKFIGDGEVGGGTLLYMAPELLLAWRWRPRTKWSKKWIETARGFGVTRDINVEPPSYDQKIDIFAAGVICYNVMTRGKRHPFKLDAKWPSLPENEHLCHVAASIVEGPLFPDFPWMDVSDNCKDFIRLLLSAKSTNRPTADEALRHPWITQLAPNMRSSGTHVPVTTSGNLVSSGKHFNDTEVPNLEIASLLAHVKSLRLRGSAIGKGPPRGAPPRGRRTGTGWRIAGACGTAKTPVAPGAAQHSKIPSRSGDITSQQQSASQKRRSSGLSGRRRN
eukprot:TRINITY_DN1485_c1_g1_i1.p1 TRINITY_DN1485_c1_g1~~TRINITY_DN1485_c1_g1_i1.p1  ORF type:complete len:862 (+),score=88.35 TRINITY_DN1485_c1_g1_i1:53-2587(+)